MIWLGIAVGAALLMLAVGILARRGAAEGDAAVDVDPLFTTGIAIAGAGVALATTLGAVMYAVVAVGLIVMGTGAYRSRHHGNG